MFNVDPRPGLEPPLGWEHAARHTAGMKYILLRECRVGSKRVKMLRVWRRVRIER